MDLNAEQDIKDQAQLFPVRMKLLRRIYSADFYGVCV
ncbi:hypothetical protein MP213Fo_25810 [Pseudochrobactrum sp. MP213Fo]